MAIQDQAERKRVLQGGGFQGPLYWYKAWKLGLTDILNIEESQTVASSSSTAAVQSTQPLDETRVVEEAAGLGTLFKVYS